MKTHPVAKSLARASCPLRLDFGVPAEPGWIAASQLAAEPLPWITGAREFIATRSGGPVGTSVAVSHASYWYFGALGSLIGQVWRRDRRVLDISAEHTYVLLAPGGWPLGIAVGSDRFHCPAVDPAAAHPSAVLSDEPGLREELRATFAEHARPLVSVLGPLGRLGRRIMWGFVTDALIEGVSGGSADRAGRIQARALLPSAIGPYIGAAEFRRLDLPGGESVWLRDRYSCCLAYKTAVDPCLGCPRLSQVERVNQLRPATETSRAAV
ncbi:MAG: ferric iron reductase [Candidatus Nanopelagicales bacterium]